MNPPLLAPTIEDSEFHVVSHTWRTSVIAEIELRPITQELKYLPGQYVLVNDLFYEIPVRSYSIANAPEPDGRISLLVTQIPDGRTSTWLTHELAVGDHAMISGPYGTFVREPEVPTPVVCLAGGSGLAPVRALAQAAVAAPLAAPFTVVFSARTENDVFGQEIFEVWSAADANFRFVRTLTRAEGEPPLGHVADMLSTLFPDLADHDVFIAGSPGFVRSSAAAAGQLGALAQQVHTEEFFAEPAPWTQTTMKGI